MLLSLFIVILMVILSAFFSGVEIAFVTSSRLKIEMKTKQGIRGAGILSDFKRRMAHVLITILIGNNLALVIFTMHFEILTAGPITRWLSLDPERDNLLFAALQSLLATPIILIFAENIPKEMFRRTADRVIFPAAFLLRFFYLLLYLPVIIVYGIYWLIQRFLLRVKEVQTGDELTRRDLDEYIMEIVEASERTPVPDLDTEMLTNALEFNKLKSRDCMIPRTEIEAAPIDTSISELMDMFIETGHSKIIIYREDLDDIEGFVHSSSMFRKPESVKAILQPVLIVPETMSASVLLAEFTGNQRSVAIVVDEFGGTSGIITIEDLVEEVFGDIEDEYDEEEIDEDMVLVVNEDGSYLIGARQEIDDLNETLNLGLPKDDSFSTLGGLILDHTEQIPSPGDSFELDNYTVVIENSLEHRIISIKLIPK